MISAFYVEIDVFKPPFNVRLISQLNRQGDMRHATRYRNGERNRRKKKHNRNINWWNKKATQKPNGLETVTHGYETQNEIVTNSHFNGIFNLKIYLCLDEKYNVFLCAAIHFVIASIECELEIGKFLLNWPSVSTQPKLAHLNENIYGYERNAMTEVCL